MENVLLDALNGISSVIGIPATVGLCWVYFRFKNTEARVSQLEKLVDELEKARETDRKEQDSKLSEIYTKLNTLVADVSFIRGRLERE